MSIALTPSAATRTEEAHAVRFYRPELDVLRFFAFLGVFFVHAVPRDIGRHAAELPHWLARFVISVTGAGAFGVDLFFALSAYLITTLLLQERAGYGDIDIRHFYARRILRIWPLYFSFLAFSIALSFFPFAEQILTLRHIVGYSLLAGNWVHALYSAPTSVAAPLWTVSIEEQFYLLWPLAMRRASVRRMAGIAIGVLVVDSICRIVLASSGASLEAMRYSTFSRIDPIALGILLALFGHKIPPLAPWQRVALLLSGVCSWSILYTLCFQSKWGLAIAYPMAALASAAVLVSVLGSQHPLLKNKILLYLGKISYGLYVIHIFGLWCATHVIHPTAPLALIPESALGLVFTILLAAASYRWLESPFLRLKECLSHVLSRPV